MGFVREALFHLRQLVGQAHHASVEILHVRLHVDPIELRRGARILTYDAHGLSLRQSLFQFIPFDL